MSILRPFRRFLADRFDKLREPGWPRRVVLLIVVVLVFLIPYPLSITGDFEVISLKPVDVRTKVQGVLAELSVKMGDQVKEGQIVGRLLDVERKLERAKVAAELVEVEAHLRLNRKGFRTEEIKIARLRAEGFRAEVQLKTANLQRETALFRAQDIAKARLDEAQSQAVQARKNLDQANEEVKKLAAGFRDEEIAQAAARVDQVKAQLAIIDQQLEWMVLKAPMAGQIVTPDQELQRLMGSQLSPGATVMEIVAPQDLVARLDIPETEFGDVKLGQSVALRSFQYPNLTFSGVVDSIQSQVTQMNEFSSVVPVITSVKDPKWILFRVHTKGRAKISLGSSPLGYVLYRRFLHSTFVKIWSWY